MKKVEDLQSEVISFLRFPLIVGVIFIHSSGIIFFKNSVKNESVYCVYDFCVNLFSEVLGRLSVPLFFFFSGFLFFYKVKWDRLKYFNKINNRIHSLLYPYLLFISLAILLFGLGQMLFPEFLSGNNTPINEWSMFDLIQAYWAIEDSNIPFVGPLWFIRNLMVIVFFSPVVYLYVRYLKLLGVIALLFLWFCGYKEFSIPGTMATSFFILGSWFSLNGTNFVFCCRQYRVLSYCVYLLFIVLDIITKDMHYNCYIHNLGIIGGMIAVVNLVSDGIKKYRWKQISTLTHASFFIYAIHEPYYTQYRKILFKLFPMPDRGSSTEVYLVFMYFFSVISFIIVLFFLFRIMNLCFPKVTRILSGGR